MIELNDISRSRAFKKLFGVELKDCNNFKNKLTTLEDNGTLECLKSEPSGGRDSRGSRSYQPQHMDLLHNVVLISAIYPKPQTIKGIVKDFEQRHENANQIEKLIGGRKDIAGIQLDLNKFDQFLTGFRSERELDQFRLKNPFIVLPQTIKAEINGYLSVLQAVRLPESGSSDFDRMMSFYLDEEIEEAYELAQSLTGLKGDQKKYLKLVISTYRAAYDFEKAFESFF